MNSAPRPRSGNASLQPAASTGLFRRSVIVLGGVFLAIVWAGIATEITLDWQNNATQARREGDNLALAFERHVDARIDALDSALLQLRAAHARGRAAFEAEAKALQGRGIDDALLQVALADRSGRLVFSSIERVHASLAATPVSVAEREDFAALATAAEDRLFIAAPAPLRVNNQWAIQVARRLTRADGAFDGIVALAIDPEYFSRFYRSIDMGAHGAITLLRDGGVVMARGSRTPPPEDPLGKVIDPERYRDHPPAPVASWSAPSLVDGRLRWFSYRHHPTRPLAVTVALADDDLRQEFRDSATQKIIFALLVTAGIMLLVRQLLRLGRRLDTAQREVRERSALYRTAIETLSEGIVVHDLFGDVVAYNLAAQRILDVDEDELVRCTARQPTWNAIYEDGTPMAAEDFPALQALFGRPVVDLVIGVETRGGERRWLNVNARTIADPADGKTTGALTSFADISEHRLAVARLAASEERLRGIVENINVVTWELDLATWQFVYVSPQVEKMFGYPVGDWLQPGFWPDHLHPDDRDRAVDYCVTCTQRAEDHDFEYRFLTRDGRSIWLRDIVKVVSDHAGRPLRLTGVMIDISEQHRVQTELGNERALLRGLIDAIPDLIFFKDRNSVYLGGNKAFADFAGRAGGELVGRTDLDFFDPATAALFRRKDEEMLASGSAQRNEEWVRYPDGRRVLLDTLKTIFDDGSGRPAGLIGISRDITELDRARESLRLAQLVFDSISDAIMVTDAEGTIISVNPAFTRITGWTADEAVGKTPRLLKSGRHSEIFYRDLWQQLADSGRWDGEIWNRRKNGELYVEWLTISTIHDGQDKLTKYISVFSDITQRKQQEQEIWRQANFDALTGLANRNLFLGRLDQAIASARRNRLMLGLMFIDLDRFKWVNDTLGHDAGDQLLIEAARRLRGTVREEDTVARLGGDEFTIILQGLADEERLTTVAEKVLEALAQPFDLAGNVPYISGSIGITVFPNDGDAAQSLLRNADIAMYQAKEGGRNRYQFYSPGMQADALLRVEIENELRRALSEASLVLHYQPIVDADSGELVAAEALVRWPHGVHGRTNPADFIPIAEESGLINPLGDWVIDEACRQWREWVDAGHRPLHICVNLSPLQFRQTDLAEKLRQALARHRVGENFLTLEITESTLIDNQETIDRSLREIKALGVRYAIDDFGTGYSSLSYLKRFPLDTVKIDRSFIVACPQDADSASLVEAIVFMAHSLKLQVVAEGVEHEGQLDFLRELGCDSIQGHLIATALPPKQFAALFGHGSLLAAPHRSGEATRFLASLRGGGEAHPWLRRLVADRHPDLLPTLDTLAIGEMQLAAVIDAHQAWRAKLAVSADENAAASADDLALSGDDDACALGRWLRAQEDGEVGRLPSFQRLRAHHREFHELAAGVASEIAAGRRPEARRRLRSLRFLESSRAIVVTLIDLAAEYQQRAEDVSI